MTVDTILRATVFALLALNAVLGAMWFTLEDTPQRELPDLNADTLRLLAEIPQPQIAMVKPDPPRRAASKSLLAGTPKACLATGPFDTIDALSELRARIQNSGGSVRVIEQEVEGRPDYLVYIEPAGSADASRRTLRELRAQSIDSYIIREGDLANAVSVGVFTSDALASAQEARIASLGYPVAMRTLNRRHKVYTLLAREASVLAAWDQGEGRTWVPCDDVAPDERIL